MLLLRVISSLRLLASVPGLLALLFGRGRVKTYKDQRAREMCCGGRDERRKEMLGFGGNVVSSLLLPPPLVLLRPAPFLSFHMIIISPFCLSAFPPHSFEFWPWPCMFTLASFPLPLPLPPYPPSHRSITVIVVPPAPSSTTPASEALMVPILSIDFCLIKLTSLPFPRGFMSLICIIKSHVMYDFFFLTKGIIKGYMPLV